jgi:tyrosyl-tRNA synthetase
MTASNGISFAEFSYQLLQAHDFWHLYQHYGCSIQVGGSDQWGNIVAGMDVIARRETGSQPPDAERTYGITTPLLVSSSGQKFGKSAGNAIWLDREKTSVFDFYQASHHRISVIALLTCRWFLH